MSLICKETVSMAMAPSPPMDVLNTTEAAASILAPQCPLAVGGNSASCGQQQQQQQQPVRYAILIDPVSTGVLLQERLFQAGYAIILVWSERTQPALHAKHYLRTSRAPHAFVDVIVHECLEDTVAAILRRTSNHEIAALCCGSEFGVLLEDELANALNEPLSHNNSLNVGTVIPNNVKSSGVNFLTSKVDKHLQASIIRNAGLDAIRQVLAKTDSDVELFLKEYYALYPKQTHGALQLVAKPNVGAGSVGVTFCSSEADLWHAYHSITAGEHKANYAKHYKHTPEAGVLLQECLDGTEYIVNMVLLDGVAKTTALWKYDKRPYNGATFVCFGKELIVVQDNPVVFGEIIDYTERAVQALGYRNGAIHAEVMYVEQGKRGPVLVEVNGRLHGGNGAWVEPAEICMGYSQLGVYVDAYLYQGLHEFSQIPARPNTCRKGCFQVKMRSHLQGRLHGYCNVGMDAIKALPSYYSHFFSIQVGDMVLKTVDMPSVPGEVTLIHQDRVQLFEDYNALNEILASGIFIVD